MKEFTRIITVQIERTVKDVDENELCTMDEAIERVKEVITERTDASYVNVIEAKDFIKD